ncbi:MAG TPA: hypothetical protein VJ140_13960 [Actinomycetota bacterium]|nr:hypothetical protein [Actinomycetota bacterium]
MEVAYLLAEQLDQPGPEACALKRAPLSYVWNDDGSTPWVCDHAHRRIDPVSGVCGYHEVRSRRGLRRLLTRYDGSQVAVQIPA